MQLRRILYDFDGLHSIMSQEEALMEFFGLDIDQKLKVDDYISRDWLSWIQTFVSRNDNFNAPKRILTLYLNYLKRK